MACASLLMVKYLTGASAYVGDVYDLDLDAALTLVHCGAPSSLASDNHEVLLAKSRLAMERGFVTMTCRPRLAAGPVTLLRLYGHDCDQMHIATGDVQQRTNPKPECQISSRDRWDFLGQCSGNHYIVAPGDIRSELATLQITGSLCMKHSWIDRSTSLTQQYLVEGQESFIPVAVIQMLPG
jgi:L-fucose isomerase-like protein